MDSIEYNADTLDASLAAVRNDTISAIEAIGALRLVSAKYASEMGTDRPHAICTAQETTLPRHAKLNLAFGAKPEHPGRSALYPV